MAYCTKCRRSFRTPPGEEQEHDCPRCGEAGRRETERENLHDHEAMLAAFRERMREPAQRAEELHAMAAVLGHIATTAYKQGDGTVASLAVIVEQLAALMAWDTEAKL